MNFFGAAYSVQKADSLLGVRGEVGREESEEVFRGEAGSVP